MPFVYLLTNDFQSLHDADRTGNIVCGILNTYMVNPTAWNLKSRSALLWAGTNTVMTVWCYFRLPEMRGRTYRELDILFEREVPARDFKKTVVTDEDDA
jgi:SP family general alpha glucoside:H+ symporter-like MFS transporter